MGLNHIKKQHGIRWYSMKKVSKSKVLELIEKSNGQVFSTIFLKKDGTERSMTCRLGVKKYLKGVGMKYNAIDKGLLPVYDMHSKGYRMINLNTVKALQINKEFYIVGEK